MSTAPEKRVALQIAPDRASAFGPAGQEAEPFASARQAVPLLWLALFDYDDIAVKKEGSIDVFASVTELSVARERAKTLLRVLPQERTDLLEAARTLSRALDKPPAAGCLAVFPLEIFTGMRSRAAQLYVQHLVNLCDLWEQVRAGLPFDEAQRQLDQICPEVFQQQDPRVMRYYLIGSLAQAGDDLADFLISEGQGEKDLQPQALAVGEQGLVLGRFDGVWKLMSASVDKDLRGVWGVEDTAFVVGRDGTALRLRQGRFVGMEVPTRQHLNAVWGLGSRWVCAVGEAGTVVVFDGQQWHPWSVGTNASLHCIAGSGSDNICLSGRESAVLRYDGYGWNRLPLPEETVISRLAVIDSVVHAAGGTRKGGELYRLERQGFVRDASLPRVDWLEGVWGGWGDELGVAPGSGPILFRRGRAWESEPVALEHLTAAAAGSSTMVLGSRERYEVIMGRTESGWQIEATLVGLRLNALWVAGNPKPPRMPRGERERADA